MRLGLMGSSGFIGKFLTENISCNSLFVYTSKIGGDPVRSYCRSDIATDDQLTDFVRDVDVIVLLSNFGSPVDAELNFPDNTLENLKFITYFLKIIENFKKQKIPRIVYISSGGTVYGNVDPIIGGIPESHPCAPVTPYGIHKYMIERLIIYSAKRNGFAWNVLRPSNIYGGKLTSDSNQGVIGVWSSCIANGMPIRVPSNLKIIRDYLHISDFANAVSLLINNKETLNRVYNVGSSVGTSLDELLMIFKEIIPNIKVDYSAFNYNVVQLPWNVLDATKLRIATNWTYNIKIREGINSLLG